MIQVEFNKFKNLNVHTTFCFMIGCTPNHKATPHCFVLNASLTTEVDICIIFHQYS